MSLSVYEQNHSDRANLLVHLVAVPVFHAGLVTAAFGHPIIGLVLCAASIATQGRAHRREVNQATFSGPFDFVKRILVEQLVTFPRFVLTGRLFAMLRDDGAGRRRRQARAARP